MDKPHQAYLALGANLGDRQANLLQAIQSIRTSASVENISSFYETRPVGYVDQPDFLNMACFITTELAPLELLHTLKQIERQMGRQASFRNAPRPIDIDILFYDDLVLETPELTIPHPRMSERAFVLVPLAEIAPEVIHPVQKIAVSELLRRVDQSGVKGIHGSLYDHLNKDMQESIPDIHASLSRTGVTSLRRIIRISQKGHDNLFSAELDLFVDLDPNQMGVHMSRFGTDLEEIIDEIALEESPNIETLASRISQQVIASQGAIRSEVHIRAVYPMEKKAPVSGKKMQELYTLIGMAVCSQRSCRHIVGVEADGMTVCPCAQEMVRDYSNKQLLKEGFSSEQVDKILKIIPIASHNQRGKGTILIGSDQDISADDLVRIIEASMSSETYDLLKRPDELFVILKAHKNPRFVEDVVREMLQNIVEIYSTLPDSTFVLAKQINYESIHKHDAFAERFGTLGEIRREIQGGLHLTRHTSLEEWLRI
ncbi:MAG TPA: GTP cyclohydrolase MptA [Anaerolineaceae bacterium]|nr:GTP cyclohydrolase MptA [Anaerolineaceae bacterium]